MVCECVCVCVCGVCVWCMFGGMVCTSERCVCVYAGICGGRIVCDVVWRVGLFVCVCVWCVCVCGGGGGGGGGLLVAEWYSL